MNKTTIGWTDYSWGFFSGCKKISEECKFCYADTFAERHRGNPAFPHGFDLTVRKHKLVEPARLLKSAGPSLIFCESMSDIGLDDDELTVGELDRLYAAGFESMDRVRDAFFGAIEATPEHRYQVLTKRPARLLQYFQARGFGVPPSVWIGTTIGHERGMSRLPYLRAFRDLGAKVLFVSAEPLLSDLVGAGLRLDGVDWLIAGGESGTHFKSFVGVRFLVRTGCHPGEPRLVPWESAVPGAGCVRRLRDESARAGCAFFFKQWGGPTPASGGRLLDGVEHDGMPVHVPGAMPIRRAEIGAATAALARKRGLPMVSPDAVMTPEDERA